jgi:lipopolysaccharide export system permease protein
MNKRFSLSLACLTFCLVGVPLGVTAQRRETSIGFALSMIIAVCYFVFIIVADSFASTPSAYPHLMMWIPNLVFMSLGAFMFIRLSRK